MFKHLQKLLLIALLCVPWVTQAQCNGTECTISISGTDQFGDGWNGASVSIYQGTTLRGTFTLTDGSSASATFTVCSDDSVRFVWGEGMYDEECGFTILNGDGSTILANAAGDDYVDGQTIITAEVVCPACVAPTNFAAVCSNGDVTFSWTDNNGSSWEIVYDTIGFNPEMADNSLTATTDSYLLSGLDDGIYEAYIRTDCGVDGFSIWVGPITFAVGGCIITVEGEDSYGDGWNGGYLNVVQGGSVVGTVSMTSGSTTTVSIHVADDTVTFVWSSGSYDSEVSISIKDGGGATVYTVTQPNAGTIYTMTNTCPSCLAPADLAVDSVHSDEIYISWNAGGAETEWVVTINDSAFVSYQTNVVFTDLNANTVYNISVVSVCGSDDTSGAVSVSPRTACGDITSLPFAEDFNSYASNSYPSCWYRVQSNSYPYVTSSYGNSIMFAGTAAVIAPLIQVLPGQMVVSFDLRKEGTSSGSMDFGYVTDPSDISTMVVLQNIDPTSTATYVHYEIDLSVVPDLDTVTSPVYITWRQNSTSTYWYYWLDNVLIEQANDCTKPQNLTVNSAAADSVVVSWDELGTASNWQVVFGPVGFQPDTVVDNVAIANSDTTAVITTLVSGQSYQVYVRSDCGDGYSNWQGPVTFTPGSVNMGVTGSSTMYVCGAAIYDNGGISGQYESSSNYTLTLYPSDDTKRFKFWGSGSTESCCDYLRIYAGTSASGTLLADIQGEGIVIDTVWTQGGPITLYFYSDGSVVKDGFVIYLACEDLPECRDIQNVNVVATTTSSVYVTWENAVGTTPLPSSYIVNVLDSTSTIVATVTTTDLYAMITGLDPNTSYTVAIVPSCDGGDGASFSVQFVTRDLGCIYDAATLMNVTVGNGSATNTYIPSYSFYSYGYSQQFFKSSELGNSAVITSLTLTPSVINQQRTYEIYMGQSADTAAASFINPDGLTCVYNGGPIQLSANDPVTFNLTTPFNYSDTANLVVIFRDMTGSWVSGNAWYGDNAWSNASRYVYQDGSAYSVPQSSGGSASSFRNTITFFGGTCTGPATCANPWVMVTTADSSSAQVAWLPGANETSWNIQYRIAGDTVWTTAASGVSATSYTITGLIPSTNYEVRVVSGCTEGFYAGSASFATECGAALLPLTEDFQNGTGQFSRNCWRIGTTNLGTSYPYPYVVHLQGDDQNGLCLFFNGAYMVLPKVAAPLNQLQTRFDFTQGGDNVHFLMGLLPNQGDPIENIIVLDTIIRSEIDTTSATVSYTFSFAGIDPQYNGYNIAFWDAFNENYSFIDNLVVEYIPSCAPVTALSASNVTSTSADVSWSSTNTTASYLVEYGPHNFTPGTGLTASTQSTNISLTGLSHSTNYDLYVYTLCGGTDTSIASQVLRFSTLCDAISTLPYSVDFENIMPNGSSATNILPNCWASVAFSGTQPHTVWGSSATYYQSPTHSLYFYDQGVVALPAMAMPINTLMVSFFDYNPSGDGMIIGAVDNTDSGFASTFTPIDTIAYTNGNNNAYQVTSYLNAYNGNYTHIAFKNYSTSGSYSTHYIDDVVIDVLPSCTPVSNLHVAGQTTSSITLDWGSYDPAASNWVVSYSTTPLTDPMQGTTTAVTAHPYTVNGLTPGTDYYFYVLNDCGAGDSSTWSTYGPVRPGVWNMRANQTDTVVMCGGTIYDDGGASGNYSNSQDSYIILRPSTLNALVSISGTSYTESSFDYLRIYDGEGTSGTELWNDYGVSSNQTLGPITSTTGSLTLYFHSDGSVQYSGFALDVSCISTSCLVSGLALDANVPASSNSLALVWNDISAVKYQVAYGTPGFDVDNAVVYETTTPNYTITGLASLINYEVYVRGICSGSDTGSWAHAIFQTAMCDNVTIAESWDSTMNSTSSSYSPIGYALYNYSYVQTIIDSAYLATIGGDISAFSFNAVNTTASDYYTHMDVYMANVSESDLSGGFIHPDSTHVFVKVMDDATLNFTTTGEQLFSFDTTFTWDGHSNILFAVNRGHGSWSSSGSFSAHTATSSKMRYAYTDSAPYDPATVSSGYTSTSVGDIRLYSCGGGCASPVLLPVTDLSYSSATINWNSNATDFEVAVKAATDAAYPAPTSVTGANSFAVSGLQPSTTYRYHVRAICDAAEDLISNWVEGTFTTDSLPCFAPADLHTTDLGYTTATLAWTAGGIETMWNIHVWNTSKDTNFTATGNPYTVTGLAQTTSYYAAISALCGNGAVESEYSDTIQFTTATCAVPTAVTTGNITATTVTVSWNGSAQSYEIEYGDRNFNRGEGTKITVNGTTHQITGLESDHMYTLYVRAICEAGIMSDYSSQVDFDTPAGEGFDAVNGGMNVSIYPNPTTSATTIALSGVNGEVSITIVDMNGRIVMSDSMSCEGDCTKTMEVSGLAQGAYFVRLNGDNVNMVKKLVVK